MRPFPLFCQSELEVTVITQVGEGELEFVPVVEVELVDVDFLWWQEGSWVGRVEIGIVEVLEFADVDSFVLLL